MTKEWKKEKRRNERREQWKKRKAMKTEWGARSSGKKLISYFSFHYILRIWCDTDRTENDESNHSSTAECVFVAAGSRWPSRCLATIRGKGIQTRGKLAKIRLTVGGGVFSALRPEVIYGGHPPGFRRTARGSGFEYLHSSPASCWRRRKVNLVPGGTAGPPCSWRI
jgi:hypothetical protein